MCVTCVEHTSHVYSMLRGNVVDANLCRGTMHFHTCKNDVIIEWYCTYVQTFSKVRKAWFIVLLLSYTHMYPCHYTGGAFGETSSYVYSCHLLFIDCMYI